MDDNITSRAQAPLFIGMPVCNGAHTLSRALDSLLGQTHARFELVISDNGSTDNTPQIAAAFALRDHRVRFLREENNRGPTWNFNRLLDIGGEHKFFMWAAHDDIWAPTYISTCLAGLEAHSGVVLCGTRARFVDPSAAPTAEEDSGVTTLGLSPVARALRYIESVERNSIFYGVYRAEVLRQRRLQNVVGNDQVFLLDLCLVGEFLTISESLLTRETGGTSRDAASIYRTLAQRPILTARFIRIEIYKAFLTCASHSTTLSARERRRLSSGLIKVGLRRHVLRNLAPRRFLWWLRYGGTSQEPLGPYNSR